LTCDKNYEHKMFETCRRQEELNLNINLKSAFCWLTLNNCITMHGTKNVRTRMEYITSREASCFVKRYKFLSQASHHEVVNPWSIGDIPPRTRWRQWPAPRPGRWMPWWAL